MTNITLAQAKKDTGWLGTITAVHEIGRYSLVEYVQREILNSATTGHTFFALYIDGKNAGESFESMEAAFLGAAVRHRISELNTVHWFTMAIRSMLGWER